jgi:hypothetical protein
VKTFKGHTRPIWNLLFDRAGRMITASIDKTVRVWNAAGWSVQRSATWCVCGCVAGAAGLRGVCSMRRSARDACAIPGTDVRESRHRCARVLAQMCAVPAQMCAVPAQMWTACSLTRKVRGRLALVRFAVHESPALARPCEAASTACGTLRGPT